ncbi:MAG: RagB/SusD family nutrient uptake outer membrane protein [Prolixibacteraceae bacterium]
MKNIVFIVLAALLLCSCSDLLEEKPQAIAAETFFNTASEVESGIAGVYAHLRNGDGFRAVYIVMLEESSDIIYGGLGSWSPPSKYGGLDATNITRVGNTWVQFYRAVRNSNILIEAIPKAKSVSDNDKDKLMGEVRFLRALAYFQLVRCWGTIPLRTEENRLEYELPRTSESEVYNLIISDLEFAGVALPTTVSNAGRATKWSAKMLLADVYFTLNQYDKATELSNEIIQSKQYNLVEINTTDDFEKLYGATVVNTPEEIFYFKFHEQDGFSGAIYFHGSGNAGTYMRQPGYNVIINYNNRPVYVNQDDRDLRKGLWYSYSGGLVQPGGLLLKKYNDKTGTNPRNSFPLYRYADCLLLYAEASCRISTGPTPAGLEALNMVHRRAYGHPSTQPSPVDFKINDYNKESFIELCIKERGYETVGESKRWFDLKRLGKAEAGRYVRENRGMEIAEKHWLWPIPVSETNFNKAITVQNPGY